MTLEWLHDKVTDAPNQTPKTTLMTENDISKEKNMKKNIYNMNFLIANDLGAKITMTTPLVAHIGDGRSIVIERCKHLDQKIPAVIGQAFSFAEYDDSGRVIVDFTMLMAAGSNKDDGVAYAIAMHKDIPPTYREAYPDINERIEDRKQLNQDLTVWLSRIQAMLIEYELEFKESDEQNHREKTWEQIMSI